MLCHAYRGAQLIEAKLDEYDEKTEMSKYSEAKAEIYNWFVPTTY